MKYDLDKNKKRIKSMAPCTFDFVLIIMSMAMLFLSYDFNLMYFGTFNGLILLGSLLYGFLWLVDMIIFSCIKSYRKKKGLLNEKQN